MGKRENNGTYPESLRELYLFASRRWFEFRFHKRKMRILFSQKDDWEPAIRRDFRFSRHEMTFGSFTNEKIEDYDLVVPLSIADLKYLNGVRHLIENNPIPIPTMESLSLCDDKYMFIQALIQNNLEDYIPKIGGSLLYPYILKKKIDSWGINSHIITDKEQECSYLTLISSDEYFCQEIILGKREYATHILFMNGKIVHSINIEYTFEEEIYIKGKNKQISTQKVGQCAYLNIFSLILDLVGYEGLCCINYKPVDGRPIIFEINPRFGGSLSPHFYSFMEFLR